VESHWGVLCCKIWCVERENNFFYHTLPYSLWYNLTERDILTSPATTQYSLPVQIDHKYNFFLKDRGFKWVLGVRNECSNERHKLTKVLIIISEEHTGKWTKVWFFKAHLNGHLTDERRHWPLIAVPIFSIDSGCSYCKTQWCCTLPRIGTEEYTISL